MSHPLRKPNPTPIPALLLLLIVAAGLGWLLLAQAAGKPSAIISYLHNLPYLRADQRLYQISSHDPNSQNKDTGRYLYQENGHYVIMDVIGAGAIERIWMNGDPITDVGHIQIYTDDAVTPTLDLDILTFFAGKTTPLLAPLVGDNAVSSGGFYSYLRLPFAHHIRVATTGQPKYYNIEYSLTANPGAANNLPPADASAVPLWQQASNAANVPFGQDKPEGGAQRKQGHLTLSSGETNLASLSGQGAITALKLKLNAAPSTDTLRLKVNVGGIITPNVDVPFTAFFGDGMGEQQVNGLPAGIDASRNLFYSYWPMPYQNGITVSLVNSSTQPLALDYEVEYNPNAYPSADYARLGTFHADWHSESPPRRKLDYPVLDAKGAGVYVGTTMIISGPVYLQEGNERIHVDGSLAPQIVGTGTEDYFNGGWGFKNGNFSLPSHGNPAGKFGGPEVTAYRWYVSDPIPFGSELVFGQGHGGLGRNFPYDNDTYTYSSVAYYYLQPTPTLTQTDEITFGATGNFSAHQGQVSGLAWQGHVNGYYETTQDRIGDNGEAITATGSVTFTVALDPNNQGAMLRRRFDYTTGWLRGQVSVDGQPVGVWYSPGNNPFKAWRDEEFLLPASATAGKSKVTIRIDAKADPHAPPGAPAWNEFHYWVFSIGP